MHMILRGRKLQTGAFLIFFLSVSLFSKAQNIANIHNELDSIRLSLCPQASFSFWAESVDDGLINTTNADSLWPTASAIKIFILPAFYSQYKAVWNTTPAQLDSILDFYPAYQPPLSVFNASERLSIDSALTGYTYKQIAEGMMGKSGLNNASYNACANIAIFLLGGPSGTTTSIKNLHPDFAHIQIGRYMLESRTPANDNYNRARDFSTLINMIHHQSIPNFQLADYPKILSCIWSGNYNGYPYYQKSGGLTSLPDVRGRVGFLIDGTNTLIYSLIWG